MSFYIIVSSDKSLEYFPLNKPYHYRSFLKSPLILPGIWKVGLTEIELTKTQNKQLYVYSNICSETMIDGEMQPLLRRVFKSVEKEPSYKIYNPIFYTDVKKTQIYDVEIYIKDDTNELATYLKEPVTITLHFKSYPFLA